MKKIGAVGIKRLKILHLISVALWFGGVVSLVALILQTNLTDFEKVNITYSSMKMIDQTVIRNGGQGIFITSIIYSIWTSWGFFKHKWIVVKWIVFLTQMIFGIFFLNGWVEQNIELLHAEKALALSNQIFINNHMNLKIGLVCQSIIIVLIIWVSVIKPWKNKNVNKTVN